MSELHRKEKLSQEGRSNDKVSERARKIAKDTFNLSETEVDQFMSSQVVRERVHQFSTSSIFNYFRMKEVT